jgi:hypothetical protein
MKQPQDADRFWTGARMRHILWEDTRSDERHQANNQIRQNRHWNDCGAEY